MALTSLTAFAPYASIGYQTTMGMGQVAVQFVPSFIGEQSYLYTGDKNTDLSLADRVVLHASTSHSSVSD